MKKPFILICTVLLTLTMSISVLADIPDLPDNWWEEALTPEEAAETETPEPDPQGRTPEPDSGPASETGCSRRSAVLVALSFAGITVAAGMLGYILGKEYIKRR